MNIGIVTTWFERGAAYVSRQHAQALRPRHRVFIYARGGEDAATDDPAWNSDAVTWGRDVRSLGFQWIDLDDFTRWLKRSAIDMVLFNEQAWWPPVLLCNRLGIPTGGYVDYYTEETVPFFACYDFLLCHTRRHQSVFAWHPQCFYIPWGTELSVYTPRTLAHADPDAVSFFHSAGMNPRRKGTDFVVQAFAQLRGDARLVVHTQVPLAAAFPHLQPLITQLQQRGCLVCYEQTVPAPGLYHLGDVYVYPSRLDGIGLTIAEALACGLPVITNDCPPMSEFINHTNGKLVRITKQIARHDGYYWPQCHPDLDDLRRCVEDYLDAADELPGLKRAARTYAESHLDWMRNAQELPDLVERVELLTQQQREELVPQIERYERRHLSLKGRLYTTLPSYLKPLIVHAG